MNDSFFPHVYLLHMSKGLLDGWLNVFNHIMLFVSSQRFWEGWE